MHGWVRGWCMRVHRFKSCLLNHVESEHVPLKSVGELLETAGSGYDVSRHMQISTSNLQEV